MAEQVQEQSFWSRRWEAFLDNAIWYAALAVGGALVALAAAFGTSEAKLPLWAVVLFAVVQVACVAAIVALFRGGFKRGAVTVSLPHPHRKLLARCDALDVALERLDPTLPTEWATAEVFNSILMDAQQATGDESLTRISRLYQDDYHQDLADANNGTTRTLVGQIRSMLT